MTAYPAPPSKSSGLQRRHFLAASALPLIGCAKPGDIQGGFTGVNHERGHGLRDRTAWPAPSITRKTKVLILGGGVAGLAAARALRLKGQDDFALLELEDAAGGNSRGGVVNGIACPLGAHYLPVPGDDAHEVQDLLEELGLRQRVAGRWQYDERHLCHSPQERLFFNGTWQDGLLPVQGLGPETLAQYQKFSQLIEQERQAARWTMPASKQPLAPVQQARAAITFATYLKQSGLTDPQLLWYLDYCCRDDFGAGITTVSAWAGIHYFASRHGFHAPGAESAEREGVLTWPEGNGWLTQRLTAPLQERLHTGRVVLRVANVNHGVEVDAFNTATQTVERWQASRAIVALPIFVAARVVQNAPDFLRQAAARTVYAPWLVANIHLNAALHDRPGAAPSWDNVLYGAPGLGYIDAMHQSLQPVPGATVLTYYRALGDVPGGPSAGRRLLLDKPWGAWRDDILAELAQAHPDLPAKTSRLDITRYGHAMAIPVPRNSSAISHPSTVFGRATSSNAKPITFKHESLTFAHSDWAGYSVFEEAFTLGHHAA
jgi:predicted NAD/FAD-dependent oxidoreductase